MFGLIATMRRGTATDLPETWTQYATVEEARVGSATLLRDDRVMRVTIVRTELPPAFVEWTDR